MKYFLTLLLALLLVFPVAAQTTININVGGSATGSFSADQYFSGGSSYANTATIDLSQISSNPPPAAIFNSERYGVFSYTIPNRTAGSAQTVTLYFAETYLSASGQRKFNVSINGSTVLSNFDIYASAGGKNKAIARSFSTTANSSGQVVIQFSSVTQNPKLNGITVAAGSGSPTLSVSPTALSVAAAANSTGTFSITSNTSWTVSSNQTWLTVNPTSGSNNAAITVTAQQNTSTSTRSATVTVSATGVTSQTVTVTQAAAGTTPTLSVSPTSVSVTAAASSTGTFSVTSNTNWTVSSNQTWLAISPASGSNNAAVTVTAQQNTNTSTRSATVTVSATGVTSQTVTVTQAAASGGTCTIPAMPSYASLPTNAYLPDPFTFMNGSRMTTKAEWTCRRAEIAALAQEFEYGYYQNTPYSATTGAKSGNSIVVTVNDNGKTISFTCSITYPSTGSAPYPAMIGVGGSNLNNSTLSSLGVAVITFPNDDVAAQANSSSRGQGKFYTMYGSSHSASATMAWAWGVGRLIDALEKTPAANIDPTRLGVTGCSRNGKGALACGAFNERIKLTIPQESGSGGAASWRVSDWQKAQGTNVQTLSQIVGENVWFRANFNQFSSTATKLPFDHHSIEALCAPRALLVIENTSMVWLGNVSTWTTGNVAHYVWEGLGIPDKMGFSQVGHSDHCGFPSSQQPEVTAYVQKFLVGGGTGNTTIMKTDGGLTFDKAKWVNWTVPTLTGSLSMASNLSTSKIVEGEEFNRAYIPEGFELAQNYPNPFNPTTVISFGLPVNSFVSLRVYNSLGIKISELAGREYSAGRHSVTFDASNLASGIYFYTIRAGIFSISKKMLLQK